MTNIAIDVVLLPCPEMMDVAININQNLLNEYEHKIVLDKKKCLPHISLGMGCVDKDKVSEINNIIQEIVQDFSLFNLRVFGLHSALIPSREGKVSGLLIENSDKLQRLHEVIMKRLWDYLSYDVTKTMLFNPSEVEDVTLFWIKDYARKFYDPSLFQPHITVGYGESSPPSLPIDFTASQIALCQLGNYCTCREVISCFELC